jgi:amylovoran biosynthesis glycosyltransferase AmsE
MSKFSILLTVYYKETASNLNQCLESLSIQTVSATEIVIVKDGMTEELEKILFKWSQK